MTTLCHVCTNLVFSVWVCVNLQQDYKSPFDDTLMTTTDHRDQVKYHQKTIPYGDVIDISHSQSSGEKELPANQEVKTPSNEGMKKSVTHV